MQRSTSHGFTNTGKTIFHGLFAPVFDFVICAILATAHGPDGGKILFSDHIFLHIPVIEPISSPQSLADRWLLYSSNLVPRSTFSPCQLFFQAVQASIVLNVFFHIQALSSLYTFSQSASLFDPVLLSQIQHRPAKEGSRFGRIVRISSILTIYKHIGRYARICKAHWPALNNI